MSVASHNGRAWRAHAFFPLLGGLGLCAVGWSCLLVAAPQLLPQSIHRPQSGADFATLGLMLLGSLLLLAFGRCRFEFNDSTIAVRGIFGRRRFPWSAIRRVAVCDGFGSMEIRPERGFVVADFRFAHLRQLKQEFLVALARQRPDLVARKRGRHWTRYDSRESNSVSMG